MAKKKKKAPQQTLSPERYIKEKARLLPLTECWITKDWETYGGGTVIVARQHKNGNYTFGIYLLDTFCCGVTESLYQFNAPEYVFKGMLEEDDNNPEMKQISYEEAHNLIYGAIAFAEEAGIDPHPSFKLTQYILEEDTEDIPLIEYEFGKDGKHFLVATSQLMANSLLPLLRKNLGGNFSYIVEDIDDDGDNEEDDASDEDDPLKLLEALDRMKTVVEERQRMPVTSYSYTHPDYPAVLDVRNKQLITHLYTYDCCLIPEETIREVLALPRESLISDLEQIALFEIGCTCGGVSEECRSEPSPDVLMYVAFFLGELRSEDSLKVILEMLRQRREFYDYYFGDTTAEVFIPTLYLLGQNRLPELMAYMKEPGLYTFARCHVGSVVVLVANLQPERRAEVIEWFRLILVFYTEHLADNAYCDGTLAGMLVNDLLDIKAKELLPEIEVLYDTGLVDQFCCGNFKDVKKELLNGKPVSVHKYPLNIYERYREYNANWRD